MKHLMILPHAPYVANQMPLNTTRAYQPGHCRFFRPDSTYSLDRTVSWELMRWLGRSLTPEQLKDIVTEAVKKDPNFGKRGGRNAGVRAGFVISYLIREGMVVEV